jgi:hypothetical protein
MTWRSSEDDENGVPSPAHALSVAEGEGDRRAGIFEREGKVPPGTICTHCGILLAQLSDVFQNDCCVAFPAAANGGGSALCASPPPGFRSAGKRLCRQDGALPNPPRLKQQMEASRVQPSPRTSLML